VFFIIKKHLQIKQNNFIDFTSGILSSSLRDFSFLNIVIHKGILTRISFLNIWVSLFVLVIAMVIITKKPLTYFDIYLLSSFLIIFAGIIYSFIQPK